MLNKLCYQGRLTRDVEFKKTQGGIPYANFTLAWSEKYNEVESKCFLPCKAWQKTAEFIQKFISTKGSEMVVEGRLQTEEWTGNDGGKQSRIVLVVDKAHFAGSKRDNANQGSPVDQVITESDEPLPF